MIKRFFQIIILLIFPFGLFAQTDDYFPGESRESESPTFFLYGKILFKPNLGYPANRAWLSLFNSKDERVAGIFTDPFGNFLFNEINEGEFYTIRVSKGFLPIEADTLYLANQSGYVVQKAVEVGDYFEFNVDFVYLQALVGYSSLLFRPNLRGFLFNDEKKPIKGMKVYPVNHTGKGVWFGRTTTSRGLFNFGPTDNFDVAGIEFRPNRRRKFAPNAKVYLANEYQQIIDSVISDDKGAFSFNGVPKFDLRLGLVPVYDQGLLYRDEFSTQFKKVYTNLSGAFTLDSLNPQHKYAVGISANKSRVEPRSFVYLFGNDGFLRRALLTNAQGMASFMVTGTERVDLNLMKEVVPYFFTVSVSGRLIQTRPIGTPLAGAEVSVYDGAGKLVGSTVTNSSGIFRFNGLEPYEHYVVEVTSEENVPGVLLFNSNRNFMRTLIRQQPNNFTFELLPSDHIFMGRTQQDNSQWSDSWW
jgi:hypothetical protein